jgi:hypothetical protein
VISGNFFGVVVNGTVKSYGDNYLNDNATPVSVEGGSFSTVTTQ